MSGCLGALLHEVQQRRAADRLVGHDEDVLRHRGATPRPSRSSTPWPAPEAVAPAGCGTSAPPFSTPCTAPGNAVLVRPADDGRDRVEVEDRRRRRDLPLERERAPRVGLGARAAAPGGDHVVGEDERAEAEEEAHDRDREVPAGPLLGVVGDAARHALDADHVHRGERRVEEDERRPEVQLAEALVVHPARHLREPVVDAGEDREQRAAEQHVVDVGDDEVRVADVDRRRG